MKATEMLERQNISKNLEYYQLYYKALKEAKGDKIKFNTLMTKYRDLYLKGN